ncbi:MAG: LysR family transcriptional regulator [Myxococcales bacterium]|nr:LysR family transcriptional regulator [Myxococcales bacterium]MCB9580839.1 LysR family transcriptional regulator [Polyangiaceae bacterium]
MAKAAPDLNDVALFVDVVKAGSFSKAAAGRGVPVSTVSRRVARLEQSLGTRLLERTTRRLNLTDVGKSYFQHAERGLEELSQGSRQVLELHAQPRGRVRITAAVSMGPMVTETLQSYLLATPEVSIEIDLTERTIDLAGEGYDIAIRAGSVGSDDVIARQISQSARQLFASAAYLERKGRPKRLSDLPKHDLIALRTTETGASWELFDRRGKKHRVGFQPRLTVNEMMASRHAAIAGIGIALLPAAEKRAGLERVLPGFSGSVGGLWLVYPAERTLTAAVRSCVDHLRVALATG